MSSARLAASAALVALLAPAGAVAAPTAVDMQEHIFGAANVNAVAGHGALTVGVSADGDLSVLAWPGPSFADQLAYIAPNDLDVRDQPRLGVHDGMGSYVGLLVTTASGTTLTWLRDPAWTRSQRYTQRDAPVPETTFARADLGLSVVLTDVVSPDVDVLTRRVVVTRAAGSPVTEAKLVVYENLSPTVSKMPMLPVFDWAFDARNDFVAAFDARARSVVHVHPSDRAVITSLADLATKPEQVDYGPVDALMRRAPSDAEVDALVDGFDTAWAPGVAALVTTEPPPESWQVGSDATPICAVVARVADNILALPRVFPRFSIPLDPSVAQAFKCVDSLPAVRAARGWTWAPEDALADLADGALSGSRLAAGQTNAALVAPLVFAGDRAEGAAVFAFGRDVAAARAALAAGTRAPAADRQATAERAGRDAVAGVALPDPALGPRVTDVALRALVNVYVARERTTGAIIASVARQPPYYLDWPRDGAFFTLGMDVAGGAFTGWATQRAEWYAGLARREEAPGHPILSPFPTTDPDTGDPVFPAHAWEMNYFGDGTPGGNIRFEIDNTALHVWAAIAHAAYLQGDARASYLSNIWPSTRDAIRLLLRWRDPATGLPWPANEDDHLELTSTLHGATTVYAALVAGARGAHAVGDRETAQASLRGARALHEAMTRTYFDPQAGLFRTDPDAAAPLKVGTGSAAWLVWPARFLDPEDGRLEAQLAADMADILRDVRGETEGGLYVMKNVVSAGLMGRAGGSRDAAREAVLRLADIATPDTLQFGEVFVTTHPPGASGPVFSARVAPPHVWEGILFYMSAMAVTAPERFHAEVRELPLPEDAGYEAAGGGCREAPTTPLERGAPALALTLAAALVAKRRLARARR